MMHDREKSDSAIVATKPTNKAGATAAESVEPRAGTERKVGEQSTLRTQRRARVSQALDCLRQVPSYTRGRRSYGAGSGGCGTFIVHTNRWSCPVAKFHAAAHFMRFAKRKGFLTWDIDPDAIDFDFKLWSADLTAAGEARKPWADSSRRCVASAPTSCGGADCDDAERAASVR